VGSVLDKKYITAAVVVALYGQGIAIMALAISAAALVLRFELDIYIVNVTNLLPLPNLDAKQIRQELI
jgi:hypothetical protein